MKPDTADQSHTSKHLHKTQSKIEKIKKNKITGKDTRIKEMCVETLRTKTTCGKDTESYNKDQVCGVAKCAKAHQSGANSSGFCDRNQNASTKAEQTIETKKAPDKRLFPFGNYDRYYGYRNPAKEDYRLYSFNNSWFNNKDVLDIGCNTGQLTLQVAKRFRPKKMVAVDIDKKLIKIAQKNIRHYVQPSKSALSFPMSFRLSYGCTGAPVVPGLMNEFPNNVIFIECNYVLDSDILLQLQKPEYDTILFLSTSKWIHLNWGDAGLQRVFKRTYAQLRPGGRMIFEPQPWDSYSKSKKINETLRKNYYSIKMKPESFCDYLLSKEVGFESCKVLDTPPNTSKGFQRPIYLLTKDKSGTTDGQSAEEPSSVAPL